MSNPNPTSSAWSRLRDHYLGLAFSTRMICLAAVAIVAILVGYWSVTPAPEQGTYLLGGQEFSPTQIHAICRALDSDGISGFQVVGSRVKVPLELLSQCASAIAKHDVLPAGSYGPLDKAAEQTTFWTTSAQDDRRWELGRQKMLAQMIEEMPDVETSTVLIDRTVPRGLRAQSEVRATVTIKPRPGRELPPFRIRQIRSMLAGSVAGLPPENVAVVDLNGRALLELGASDTTSDDLLMRMKQFEDHFTSKIRNVLSYLPDVMVTVSVELDTTRQRRTEQVVVPTDNEPEADTQRQAASSAPAVSANAAVDLEPAEEPRPPSEPRTTQQQTWEEHVPLAPKSVTVAIEVPQDFVAALAPNESDSPDAWKNSIRDRVMSAIPAGVTANVHVASYPRKLERTPATTVGAATVLQRPWFPWVVSGVAITLILTLALGGLRWRHARSMSRLSVSRPVDAADRSVEFAHAAADETGDKRRDLVRIERTAPTRGRGPHLIQTTISGFEDLRRLAPASLQAVLGAVDSRLWAPALRGASRELSERILTHMPARAAVLLRHEIEFPGPVRLGDVETAQQEILEVVRRLDHTGDLMLDYREEIYHELNDRV
jgi:flagellar biosynthesis/type III secretory pathway M-ring protein FliF/YscJ